jgi:hypothetical protein
MTDSVAVLQIFNTEIVDPELPIVDNVISTRIIKTDEGQLFLSEVGRRVGDDVDAISNVTGGTGKFKNATGQLVLTGVHGPGATIDFTHEGTIILSQ